jgi:uncharacterized membrane protein
MDRLPSIGRTFYAIAMLGFGALHLGYGDFVTRVVPWWPAAIPGRTLWAYALGVLLVLAGGALLVDRRTVTVAALLGTGFLISFLLLGVPFAADDSPLGGRWTVAAKALALSGGGFLVARASTVAADRGTSRSDGVLQRIWLLGPWFFAGFLVLCGVQHFIHVAFVVTLVPAWIPGALFWTYGAGVALIAGGLGLLVPATARLAGLLSGVMIFSWVFLVHIPRAAGTFPETTGETTAVFEAVAMSGIAWLAAVVSEHRRAEPRAQAIVAARPGTEGNHPAEE